MLDSAEVLVKLRIPMFAVDKVEPRVRTRLLGELTSRQWEPPAPEVPPFVVTEREATKDESDASYADRVLSFRYVTPLALPPPHWWSDSRVPEEKREYLFVDYAADSLVFASRQLLLCANLAAPGVLSAVSFHARFAGAVRDHHEMMLSDALSSAVAESRDRGWPPIEMNARLDAVWLWARSVPSFIDGVGETPVGRAIAAFSHLFVGSPGQSSDELLFWALLGLESIYGRGREGLAEQLREKSHVLLGMPATHKKVVSRMYDFRSRFVHGDIDIPFRGAPFDELSGYTEKMDEGQSTGIALLLSTLQALAKVGRTEIEFEYKIAT